MSDFIEQGGGKAKGGQLVRMIDINLDYAPALFADGDQADAMKEHCADHYGHAGPEFLRRVADLASGWKKLDLSLLGPAASPIAVRARKRFGLVLHTGCLAARAQVLPWTEEQIMECVRLAYAIWLGQVSTVSDTDRGICAVANFVMAQESRFETSCEAPPPRDRAGWKRDQLYHFTPAAFREACAGADATKVKRALLDAGLLHISKGLSSVIRVEGQCVTVVSVKAAILSSLVEAVGSNGNTRISAGTKQDTGATTGNESVVAGGNALMGSSQSATSATGLDREAVAAQAPAVTEVLLPIPALPVVNGKRETRTWEAF
ncbi:hypothetical protein [Marinobacterium aestuariivivens]|uniref:Uncharacterized protein n=1 Tax=Marinobacterium aestuariivivens TaxID=1698799 RepID=A0ABW1ZZ49_9GAMM